MNYRIILFNLLSVLCVALPLFSQSDDFNSLFQDLIYDPSKSYSGGSTVYLSLEDGEVYTALMEVPSASDGSNAPDGINSHIFWHNTSQTTGFYSNGGSYINGLSIYVPEKSYAVGEHVVLEKATEIIFKAMKDVPTGDAYSPESLDAAEYWQAVVNPYESYVSTNKLKKANMLFVSSLEFVLQSTSVCLERYDFVSSDYGEEDSSSHSLSFITRGHINDIDNNDIPFRGLHNGELKRVSNNGSLYAADYSLTSVVKGLKEYGYLEIDIPIEDFDENGLPDWIQLDQAVDIQADVRKFVSWTDEHHKSQDEKFTVSIVREANATEGHFIINEGSDYLKGAEFGFSIPCFYGKTEYDGESLSFKMPQRVNFGYNLGMGRSGLPKGMSKSLSPHNIKSEIFKVQDNLDPNKFHYSVTFEEALSSDDFYYSPIFENKSLTFHFVLSNSKSDSLFSTSYNSQGIPHLFYNIDKNILDFTDWHVTLSNLSDFDIDGYPDVTDVMAWGKGENYRTFTWSPTTFGNWRYYDWIGPIWYDSFFSKYETTYAYFNNFESDSIRGWIYSPYLNWVYVSSAELKAIAPFQELYRGFSAWFYFPDRGWYYSNSNIFPYFFDQSNFKYIDIFKEAVFDYEKSEWERF